MAGASDRPVHFDRRLDLSTALYVFCNFTWSVMTTFDLLASPSALTGCRPIVPSSLINPISSCSSARGVLGLAFLGATVDPTSQPWFAKVCCTTFALGSKIVDEIGPAPSEDVDVPVEVEAEVEATVEDDWPATSSQNFLWSWHQLQ